jgi:hypothetical protein
MIMDAWFLMIAAMVDTLAVLLPEWAWLNPFEATTHNIPTLGELSLNDGGNPLALFAGWAAQYNKVIPVEEAYGLMVLYIGVQVALMGFQALRFILNIVRGAGA